MTLQLTNPSGPDLSRSSAASIQWAGARSPLIRGTVLYHQDFLCTLPAQTGGHTLGTIDNTNFLHTPASLRLGAGDGFFVNISVPPFETYQVSAWVRKTGLSLGSILSFSAVIRTVSQGLNVDSFGLQIDTDSDPAVIKVATPGSPSPTYVGVLEGFTAQTFFDSWVFVSFVGRIQKGYPAIIVGPYELLYSEQSMYPNPQEAGTLALHSRFGLGVSTILDDWWIDSFTVTGW
jgi:hypothetical protein